MYSILTGSCTGKPEEVSAISDAMIKVATNRTYELATNIKEPTFDPQYNRSTRNWKAECFVPDSKECDFILVVLAPMELGISPIWPFYLDISGPLFSIIIWEDSFIVMEEEKDPVTLRSADEIEKFFAKFVHGKKKMNEYVNCSLCGASVNKKNIEEHENEKCHNRVSK